MASADHEAAQLFPKQLDEIIEKLEEAFESMKNMINIFESQDSNFEWSRKVAADVKKAIACYHEIYNEKKKTVF